MRQEHFRGHLETLILAVLSSGALHGYAISQELATRSEGALSYPTGSLYPALRRLEAAKLIAGEWSDDNGRRRRTYTLTTAGQRMLATDRDDWRQFVSTVTRILDPFPTQ